MDVYAWVFGGFVALTMLTAWLSHSHVYQKLGLLLLAAWAVSNLAVSYLGFGRAPLIIPSVDAVIGILVATVGYANRSRVALVVFALYVLVGVVHVAGFVTFREGTYTYYAMLNVLFLLQLLSVGGAGAWMAIRHRPPRGHQWTRPDPASG